MDYEDLMKSMDASADEKKEALMQKARESAEQIEEDARVKADEIVRERVSAATKALESDRNRQLYEARSAARSEVSGIRHEYFSRAFDSAARRFAAMRERNGYAEFFRRSLIEALEALGEKEFVLHIDQRDEELCGSIVASLGLACAVRADITTAGGLNASTTDGRVVIFNNVESRLASARGRYRREVFSLLFGD
jgi:V/A-type H+/Na+-transporting ATPase subunit E